MEFIWFIFSLNSSWATDFFWKAIDLKNIKIYHIIGEQIQVPDLKKTSLFYYCYNYIESYFQADILKNIKILFVIKIPEDLW